MTASLPGNFKYFVYKVAGKLELNSYNDILTVKISHQTVNVDNIATSLNNYIAF